jgi:hypothetical protein
MDSTADSRSSGHTMKLTKRQQRTARKLVLPMIAVALMIAMMSLGSSGRPRPAALGALDAPAQAVGAVVR